MLMPYGHQFEATIKPHRHHPSKRGSSHNAEMGLAWFDRSNEWWSGSEGEDNAEELLGSACSLRDVL